MRAPIHTRVKPARAAAAAQYPNEFEWQRITRSLARRSRYRYVEPLIERDEQGVHIMSPCCSRNIDAQGGMIDIARLQFDDRKGLWRLFAKNHDLGGWEVRGEGRLHELLDLLNQDPQREFWP